MSLTRILIDTSAIQIQDTNYQRLYSNARSIQFAGLLAFYLNSILTLEPFLLQEKLAFTQKFLAPGISIHTGHGTAFHPAELHDFFPTLPTMSLTRILIDSASIQIQDADYQRLYNNARSVQFDEFLAFYLNSLLTLEPLLLQKTLALTQIFLELGISIHTSYGTAFQSHQGDNDVLHTSETPAHNIRPIEMNSSSAPQPVDTQGNEANLPTIDASSEIGSMGGLFDRNFDDDVQGPPQTPQHASSPVPSYYQDRNNDGTLSRDMLSAQNIPSIETGSNTVVADHHMEQVDPYDHEYSSSSMVGATPDLAQTSDLIEQNFASCQNSQRLGCFTPPECITDQDSPSYSSLVASPGIGRSPLTVSTSDCNQSSHDTGECLPADSNLAGTAGVESYPTPVSNPSHTPKPANRVQKRKPRKATREKAIREDGDVSASPLSALERGNPSMSNEINSPQMGLLRCLVSKACQVTNGETLRDVDKFNDETLRMIYETGDQIVRSTCVILNDWSEWLLREFQLVLLPPYHSLSTVEKCVAASRILVEPKDGSHTKFIPRRLAQVLLYIFVHVYKKELEKSYHRNGRKPMAMAHDSIMERIAWNRNRLVDSKNYGKRWWRLGSGIGIITILTCAPDSVIGDMENRTYTDDFLKLLINYVRNAYPNAVAHFQSLDPIIQSLFANTLLPTNASVRPDGLHLEFNTLSEQVQWFNTEKAMEVAMERFLRVFK